MRLRDDALVRPQQRASLIWVDMQRPQDKYQPAESCVTADGLQPVIVDVEQHHLRLSGLKNEITKLLKFDCCLEWQLQLTARDHNVGKVQQMDLQRVQHAFARHNDALRLLFNGERADQSSNLREHNRAAAGAVEPGMIM